MDTQLNQQEAVQTETNQKKQAPWVWVLLVIFVILFLLTTVVLGSRLYELATRDKYTVDLGIDAGADGALELFKIEYANETGDITVQGANGQNVIAPGTTVSYDIRLRNREDVTIDFLMTPQIRYLTGNPVPLQVKLSDSYGNYLLGSDTEWVSVDELNSVAHKGAIHQGEVFTYHLSWQWVFETGEEGDVYDTQLGNGNGEPGVEISILTESSANPAKEKHVFNMMHLLGEGFGCCWCCYLVWLLLLVIVALLVWIWRLRKRLNEQADILEEYETRLSLNGLPTRN